MAMYLYDQMTPMQRLATDNLLWGNPRFVELDTKLGLSQFRCKDIMLQVKALHDCGFAAHAPLTATAIVSLDVVHP